MKLMESIQVLLLECIVAVVVNATEIITSIDITTATFPVAHIVVTAEASAIIVFVDIIKGLAQFPMQVATMLT